MKYFEVIINETGKSFSKNDTYKSFNEEKETFKTLKELKNFLTEKYAGHKKVKMYCDDEEGNSKHIGWIYCFKNKDISHNSDWWLQQDWVSVYEVEKKKILI